MRENKIKGSRSLDGGIVVFPRPETPGSWQVMWRTEIGRRYKTFPSLAEANYFASEMQRQRRENGFRVSHGLMSPEELKDWSEFRKATNFAPLHELLSAWNDRQVLQSGLPIGELAAKFVAMRQSEGVSRANYTNAVKRLYVRLLGYGYTAQRFEQGIKASEPLGELSAKDGSRKAFLDGLSPYDRRMLEKARAYEARLSAHKVDARRLFPLEIKGFPTATQIIINRLKASPNSTLLELDEKNKR